MVDGPVAISNNDHFFALVAQAFPWRGLEDSLNNHPVDYTLTTYNHLFIIYLVSSYVMRPLPVASVLLFMDIAGLLSYAQHSDVDINLPIIRYAFKTGDHLGHHATSRHNYGQYTMLWDRLLGTYICYNGSDDKVQ